MDEFAPAFICPVLIENITAQQDLTGQALFQCMNIMAISISQWFEKYDALRIGCLQEKQKAKEPLGEQIYQSA